jgi:hypothetical protein
MTLLGQRKHPALALIALVTSMSACATPSPDVLATQQSPAKDGGDHGFKPIPTVLPCRAGKYEGTFSSVTAGDAAQLSTLKGLMTFELIQVQSGEFFKVSSGQKLQGSSEQGDTFTADIDADNSGCREGVFNVKLQNGAYTLAQSQLTFAFIGTVDGTYLALPDKGYEGFLGRWTAYWVLNPDTPTAIANGQWSATLTESL